MTLRLRFTICGRIATGKSDCKWQTANRKGKVSG
jgi:hypothetical protein